jgi:hypothetical protein
VLCSTKYCRATTLAIQPEKIDSFVAPPQVSEQGHNNCDTDPGLTDMQIDPPTLTSMPVGSLRPTGLTNHGNTCHLNSILQVLYQTPICSKLASSASDAPKPMVSALNMLFNQMAVHSPGPLDVRGVINAHEEMKKELGLQQARMHSVTMQPGMPNPSPFCSRFAGRARKLPASPRCNRIGARRRPESQGDCRFVQSL